MNLKPNVYYGESLDLNIIQSPKLRMNNKYNNHNNNSFNINGEYLNEKMFSNVNVENNIENNENNIENNENNIENLNIQQFNENFELKSNLSSASENNFYSSDTLESNVPISEIKWVSECRANAGRDLELNLLECELETPFIFQSIQIQINNQWYEFNSEKILNNKLKSLESKDSNTNSSNNTIDINFSSNSINNNSNIEYFQYYLTFANGQFRVPFKPSELYMDKDGRLCQYFHEKPWSKFGSMKGILSDVLCNKLKWKIIEDIEEFILIWNGNEYIIPIKEDKWNEEVLSMIENRKLVMK